MFSSLPVATIIVCCVLPVLSLLSVLFRFRARKLTRVGYAADDWIILGALLPLFLLAGSSLAYAIVSGPQDFGSDEEMVVVFLKAAFAAQILFPPTILAIKASILLLYKRIFARKSFYLAINIMIVLAAAWSVTSFFGILLRQKPVSAAWDPSRSGFTINFGIFGTAMAGINLVLDLVTLCLPLFVISTLCMSFKKKLMVSGIIWLGAFCVIASVIRLYHFALLLVATGDQNFTDIGFQTIIWSLVEPSVSVIAACLPTLAPLFRKRQNGRSCLPLHKLRLTYSFGSHDPSTEPSGSAPHRGRGMTSPSLLDVRKQNSHATFGRLGEAGWQKLESGRNQSDVENAGILRTDEVELLYTRGSVPRFPEGRPI